jgi:hypothetical protein
MFQAVNVSSAEAYFRHAGITVEIHYDTITNETYTHYPAIAYL